MRKRHIAFGNANANSLKGLSRIITTITKFSNLIGSITRPIFYQIGARAAKVSNSKVSNNKVFNNKVSNNKVSNNKVSVLRMRALFIWLLAVTKYSLIFVKPSASRTAFCLSQMISP